MEIREPKIEKYKLNFTSIWYFTLLRVLNAFLSGKFNIHSGYIRMILTVFQTVKCYSLPVG